MDDYFEAIESKFDFLVGSGIDHFPVMTGFYKKTVLHDAPWCFECGYWNLWFVLSFVLDNREGSHLLCFGRHVGGDLPGRVECYYDLDGLIADREPEWKRPSRSVHHKDDVPFFLDAYACVLGKIGQEIFTPTRLPGRGVWSFERYEKFKVP